MSETEKRRKDNIEAIVESQILCGMTEKVLLFLAQQLPAFCCQPTSVVGSKAKATFAVICFCSHLSLTAAVDSRCRHVFLFVFIWIYWTTSDLQQAQQIPDKRQAGDCHHSVLLPKLQKRPPDKVRQKIYLFKDGGCE